MVVLLNSGVFWLHDVSLTMVGIKPATIPHVKVLASHANFRTFTFEVNSVSHILSLMKVKFYAQITFMCGFGSNQMSKGIFA